MHADSWTKFLFTENTFFGHDVIQFLRGVDGTPFAVVFASVSAELKQGKEYIGDLGA